MKYRTTHCRISAIYNLADLPLFFCCQLSAESEFQDFFGLFAKSYHFNGSHQREGQIKALNPFCTNLGVNFILQYV